MTRPTGEEGRADLERVELMGVRINRVTLEDATRQLVEWARTPSSQTRHAVFTGFHGLWLAQHAREVREMLNGADLFCPDGMAPVVLSRLVGRPLPERVPGPDVMARVLGRASSRGLSSYLLGDTPGTLRRLSQAIGERYPGHEVAGAYSPPFRDWSRDEHRRIVERINRAEPDFLWVALGFPKQDLWIRRHRDALQVPVAAGVGAAFRYLSGQTARAPGWLQRAGLEWVWRLLQQPAKLWRRTVIGGSAFAVRAAWWLLRTRLRE